MGFLSEIKKLLFVKKSVAKSGAEKGMEYTRDKAEDIIDSSKDFVSETGSNILEKTSGLRDAIREKAGDIVDKTSESLSNVKETLAESEIVKKAADVSESVGDKVLDTGEAFMEKAKDVSENVGGKVLDVGEDLGESFKSASESIGEKVLDAKDAFVDKAKDIGEDISEKFDETMEKAQRMSEEEAAMPKKEFADETLDAGGSLLEDTDDFFSKADKFADGDYDSFSEGKITVTDNIVETTQEKITAAGFTDADGDGDEIIDDATIISEEE